MKVVLNFFHHNLPWSSFVLLTIVPDLDLGNQSGKPTLVFEGKVGDKSLFQAEDIVLVQCDWSEG